MRTRVPSQASFGGVLLTVDGFGVVNDISHGIDARVGGSMRHMPQAYEPRRMGACYVNDNRDRHIVTVYGERPLVGSTVPVGNGKELGPVARTRGASTGTSGLDAIDHDGAHAAPEGSPVSVNTTA